MARATRRGKRKPKAAKTTAENMEAATNLDVTAAVTIIANTLEYKVN